MQRHIDIIICSMDIDGVIACSVEKWVSLVNKLTPSQRFTFYETEMEGMLRIPSVKMRDNLLALMIHGYNPSSKKFMVQEAAGKKGLISLRPDDVFAIFGLKNEGVDVSSFLSMDQGKAIKKFHLVLLTRRMYLYWEKVQPSTGPQYDPLALLSPLMRNWTEAVAEKRDKYDFQYGRGVGMIDDTITEEYRLNKIRMEQAEINKKSSTRKSNITGRRTGVSTSEASATQNPIMDRILTELKHIRKDMLRMPELCAQRVIEKLNKSVVFYKAGDIEKEEENEYGENSETRNYGGKPRKEFVYNPDMDNFKTPGKKNVQEDDEDDINDSEEKRPYHCTPEYFDSFKGDKEDPIEVPKVSDEKSVTSLGTDEIAARGSVDSIGEDEVHEEVVGKRKRKVSNLVKSPYVPVIPTKRAKRSAKAKVFQDEYDVIKASVKFVRAYERSAKHRKKEIFNDGMREGLSVERACKILDHQWLTGDVINAYSSYLLGVVGDNRHIMPTWLVNWLLEFRPDTERGKNDNEVVAKKNGPVNRCTDEYFKKDKIYIPLNKGNTHWVSVVMHRPKEEFQVLDSLMGPELDSEIRDKVEELTKQLGYDIRDANASGAVNYPDVSTWPINTYTMPQQEDGNSCGIFVLRCFQYWNGGKMDFSQF
nr:uncharacterized protein LOC109787629 [Aegilops tauschii subsp. strangulata]